MLLCVRPWPRELYKPPVEMASSLSFLSLSIIRISFTFAFRFPFNTFAFSLSSLFFETEIFFNLLTTILVFCSRHSLLGNKVENKNQDA